MSDGGGLHEKRRLAANTLYNGLAQSAAMVASLIFMPLLVRSFGLTHYGLFMLASSVTAYASLADFGVGTALTKMVAERRATGDAEDLPKVVGTGLLFYLAAGAGVALLMAVVAGFSQAIFHVDAGDASVLRNMLLLGALFQLVYWPASTARHVLAGFERYGTLAKAGLLYTGLSILATLAVVLTGEGPLLLVGLNGVAMVLVAMFTIASAVRLAGIRPSVRLSGHHLGAVFAFSAPVFAVQIADVLFYQQTDRVILGVLAGAAAVGLYEAAAKFNSLVTYVSSLTVSAVLPLASGMEASGRREALRSLFLRGSKYIATLVAPAALTLALLAEPIIRVWLGEAFAGQGTVAAVLVLPHMFVSLGVMGDAIALSRGRMGKRIPYILGQAVVNVVLSVLLVPRYGVLGVAVGTALAHAADFPLHIRFLLAEVDVPFGAWLRRVIAPIYPQLLLPLALGVALRASGAVTTLPSLALAAVVMVGTYWLFVFRTGLSHDEREELKAVVGSVGLGRTA